MKTRFLELISLCGFAIAQPLFDLFGQNPEFIVAHRLHGASLFLLVLGIVALPPLLILAVELMADSIRPRFATALHYAFLALLFGATILAPLQRNLALGAILPLLIASAAGAGLAWLVSKKSAVRNGLRLGALAVLVFAALFLMRPELWALLTAGAPASSEPATGGAESDAPVLVVVLDALPLASILDAGGEIDAGRFPNLASLAADGVWFKNASTSSDFTARAVPSILSGRFPSETSSAHWSAYPDNLFTLFAPTHEIVAAEWATSLCPPLLNRSRRGEGEIRLLIKDVGLVYAHALLPLPLRQKLPSVSSGWRAFAHAGSGTPESGTIGQKVAHIDSFIDQIGPRSDPAFYFLHTVLPHRPYGLYRSGKYYSLTGSELGGRTEDGKRVSGNKVAAHAYQRHLLQAAYVDSRLGDILSRWREVGLYDDALIVVVADHGVSFVPERMARALTSANAADILPVPLIMKLPGGARAGEVSLRNVETIDILPTMADLMRAPVSFHVDGQSAFDDSLEPRSSKRAIAHVARTEGEYPQNLVPGARESAMRRISMFGEADSTLFQHGDRDGLVGRTLEELRVVSGEPVGFSVDSQTRVIVYEHDSLLPGEVFGFVRTVRHSPREKEIVIAVDGIISVVTRPYRPWPDQQLAVWYALLPETTLGAGEHRIEPFLVEHDESGITLRGPDTDEVAPSYLGLPLGSTAFLGVETIGILESKGRARNYVRFDVPMRVGERPRSLSVEIEGLDEYGTDITIEVNGVAISTQRLEPGTWRKT